jgi:anti-anti-sigma regulatory factor
MINDRFKIDIETANGQQKVFLRGNVDEDADFEAIKKIAGTITINFRDVKSINSCGIRSWVNFLKDIAGRQVVYEECPPIIVRQMNMVPSFLGAAKVVSVYVPYVSDETDEEKLILFTAEKFTSSGFSVPETIKEESGELELDGNPQQYFAFTKKMAA